MTNRKQYESIFNPNTWCDPEIERNNLIDYSTSNSSKLDLNVFFFIFICLILFEFDFVLIRKYYML